MTSPFGDEAPGRFESLLETRTIELKDLEGTRPVRIKNATTHLKRAVAGAECILIPLPATTQGDLAKRLAPHLETGQVIYLPPGTFGTYLFAKEMKACGNRCEVSFAETGTLPYLARKHGGEPSDHQCSGHTPSHRGLPCPYHGLCPGKTGPDLSRR